MLMMHLLQHTRYTEFGEHCNIAIRFKVKRSKLSFRYGFTAVFSLLLICYYVARLRNARNNSLLLSPFHYIPILQYSVEESTICLSTANAINQLKMDCAQFSLKRVFMFSCNFMYMIQQISHAFSKIDVICYN